MRICISGSACIEYINQKLFYYSIKGERHELVITSEEDIYNQVNALADNDDLKISTEERLEIKAMIANYMSLESIVDDALDSIENFKSHLKLYILVREDIQVGHAINCAAHSACLAVRTWQNDPVFEDWYKYSFRKVTCKVSRRDFEESKKYPDHIVFKEDVLNDTEVAIIFKPRETWPDLFKKAKLYS